MKRTLWIVVALAVILSLLTTGIALAAPAGTVTPRDDKAISDKIVIKVTGLTPPAAGNVYVGWLVNSDGSKKVNTGVLTVAADGSADMTYTSPTGENLVGLYSAFVITSEKDADKLAAAPKGSVILEAPGAPAQALAHIRHLDYQWASAPNQTGLAIGTLKQAQLASQHANFALDALKAGDLATAKMHTEHVVNIIEGSKGPNFGDLNGDGKTENPGDGFGLLEYAKGTAQHAGFAAGTPDASANVKLHSPHVVDTANNVVTWATQARDKALAVIKAPDAATALPLATDMARLTTLGLNGNSTKPATGEGGALTVWEHAQNMATFIVATTTPAPAPTAAALPASGNRLPVELLVLVAAGLLGLGIGLRRLAYVRNR